MAEHAGFDHALSALIATFGAEVKPKLKGAAGTEDQLRGPFETLTSGFHLSWHPHGDQLSEKRS